MTRTPRSQLKSMIHYRAESKRRERWLRLLTQRVMCRLHIPDDASLVWLIGDGDEFSNYEAVRTRIDGLLQAQGVDWCRVDMEPLVRLVGRELLARLEEAQGG